MSKLAPNVLDKLQKKILIVKEKMKIVKEEIKLQEKNKLSSKVWLYIPAQYLY